MDFEPAADIQAKKLMIVQGPATIWPIESPSFTSSQYRGQLPLISSFFLSASILVISSSVYLYGLTKSSYFALFTVAWSPGEWWTKLLANANICPNWFRY